MEHRVLPNLTNNLQIVFWYAVDIYGFTAVG